MSRPPFLLRHEHQRLSVQAVESHDGAVKTSRTEGEGHNVVFARALQATRPTRISIRAACEIRRSGRARGGTSWPVHGPSPKLAVTDTLSGVGQRYGLINFDGVGGREGSDSESVPRDLRGRKGADRR